MPLACVRGPGHPDQICDLVAATIVEEYERRDPAARLHIRVMGGHGALFIAGEVASSVDFDVSSAVKRVLGNCGVRENVEPFIALEPMAPGWATEFGARDGASVVGYATRETPSHLPVPVVLAKRVARLLESKRVGDEEWFWLESDYEVSVEKTTEKDRYVIVVRVGHADSKPLVEIRQSILALLEEAKIPGPIRINPAGEETRFGLAHRVGSSARHRLMYGSHIPVGASGVGLHSSHPLNIGAWLARAAARECAGKELGEAIMVSVSWLPLEARPHQLRIRNERGDDLGQVVPLESFDLRRVNTDYLAPGLLTQSLQAGYIKVDLPWEKI